MKVAVVTFANDVSRYEAGEQRLKKSLIEVGYTGDYFHFKNFQSINSPTQHQVPYAFKPYSIKKVKDMGYDIVIWIDSAVYPTKNFDHFIKHIEVTGHAFFDNIGFVIRDHTSDNCLE